MRNSLLIIATLIMLASCKKQEANSSFGEGNQNDSISLRVAIMPVLSALPIYYAEQTGMMDSAGLEVQLLRYSAQLDIDTTLIRKHADVACTDLIRVLRLNANGGNVCAFMSTHEPLSMIALKGKRVKKESQMKEKMIAVSRLCATDYWLDEMLKRANMKNEDIYRPQINDVQLRSRMITNGLMEGAILPEPYATWLCLEGQVLLQQTKEDDPTFSVWCMQSDIATDKQKKEQVRQFAQIYQKAVQHINDARHPNILRQILSREYNIPAAVLDSLKLPKLHQAVQPKQDDKETAIKWLEERNAKFQTESAITESPVL